MNNDLVDLTSANQKLTELGAYDVDDLLSKYKEAIAKNNNYIMTFFEQKPGLGSLKFTDKEIAALAAHSDPKKTKEQMKLECDVIFSHYAVQRTYTGFGEHHSKVNKEQSMTDFGKAIHDYTKAHPDKTTEAYFLYAIVAIRFDHKNRKDSEDFMGDLVKEPTNQLHKSATEYLKIQAQMLQFKSSASRTVNAEPKKSAQYQNEPPKLRAHEHLPNQDKKPKASERPILGSHRR